jgi:hypothetical protein
MESMVEKWGSDYPDPTAPGVTRRGVDFAKVYDNLGRCLRAAVDRVVVEKEGGGAC